MKYNHLFLMCFFSVFFVKSQTVISEDKFDLPDSISETSGLIYYSDKLITHNDSGNAAELYEVNTLNGAITRTVTVAGATNIDWEDIAQNDTYIFIGDIGNNNGNRTDLKFYRILKTDFDSNSSVTPDIINYSYADQTDFTPSTNNNNWDSEAFIVYDDYLLLFSKNWVNNEVDVYAIPSSIGTHSAINVSNYNAEGLITGADIVGSNKIYLSGYSASNITPFLIEINDLNISTPSNLDVFSNSNTVKLTNFLPFGNQVEGISFIESNGSNDTLYISNEKLIVSILTFPSKLRELTVDNSTLSSDEFINEESIILHPNPFDNHINLSKKVDEIKIYNTLGICVLNKYNANFIDTSSLAFGFYIILIKYKNIIITKKIIK